MTQILLYVLISYFSTTFACEEQIEEQAATFLLKELFVA